jgi:folate-binding Fe-S cluster repair protein YgfZ
MFLASDGKVQNLFWVFLESFGIRIFVHSTQQESLYQLVERYHFADAFTTQKKAAIHTTWEPANNPSVVGLGIKQDLFYEGFWRSTKFIFSVSPPNDSMSEENESKWNAHCEQNQIPPFSEYSQQLVFKAKLEDLCDAGKGCYIGQEVVERVRTRDLRKG